MAIRKLLYSFFATDGSSTSQKVTVLFNINVCSKMLIIRTYTEEAVFR